MFKKFCRAVGVSNILELLITPGRVYFASNLLYLRRLDKKLGTDFCGGKYGRMLWDEIGTTCERANDYSATPRCLISTLKSLSITGKDSIIDMGCGKGLAMYYMAQFPFERIAGIELSKNLAEDAKRNLNKLFHNAEEKDKFKIICEDAGKYSGYENYNFFYIYNSFPQKVMGEVVDRIHESILIKPRRVIILYLYPEYPDEIINKDYFILVKKGKKSEIRDGMHIYVNKEFQTDEIFNKKPGGRSI